MKTFFFLGLICASFSSWGRVIDSNLKDTNRAVVSLSSYNGGVCSGSVVGLYPPTVITARHCVETKTVRYKNIEPESIIKEEFNSSHFSTENARLPGDVAILIYSFNSDKLFRKDMSEADLFVLRSVKPSPWQKVQFCGFGSAGRRRFEAKDMGVQRCGENYLVTEDRSRNFSAERANTLIAGRVNTFSELYPTLKAKYIYSLVQEYISEYGSGTRYGLGALLPPQDAFPFGSYDEVRRPALTQLGDSGGPLFVKDQDGKNVLLGVTSGTLSPDDLTVGAFYWRLDHEWSKALLRKAYNYGGDVKVSP